MKSKVLTLGGIRRAHKSTKNIKRLGRGPGSGHGKTASKGHKGQHARKGFDVRIGFEGGQMPIYRRVPKSGFVSHFSKPVEISPIELAALEVQEVDFSVLQKRFGGNTVSFKILLNNQSKRKGIEKSASRKLVLSDRVLITKGAREFLEEKSWSISN